MTTFNIKIPPGEKKTITFDPGVPVYEVVLCQLHNREFSASVSYDRATGTLQIIIAETGV